MKPKLTSTNLKSTKGKPCSEDCFRLVDEEEDYLVNINDFPILTTNVFNSKDGIFWEDEDDTKRIESILKLIPDQSPCDLAVICRKQCREVRDQLFS